MKKKFGFAIIFLFLVPLVYNACTSSSSTSPANTNSPNSNLAADFSKLKPSCFIPDSLSPFFKMGSFFSGSNFNDPHVIKVGNQFVMYASADTNFSRNIKVYRFESMDGKSWTMNPSSAVFERNPEPTAWDHESTETPAIIFFKGLYYLFYTGYKNQSDPTDYKIGYATSSDGISWTRQAPYLAPTNPTGGPDFTFMQYVVGEPAPVVFNDKIYLYFAAQGANLEVGGQLMSIGLITSADGQNWGPPEQVLVPDQNIYPHSQWRGYSTPHAALIDNKVHLFFDVVRDPDGNTFQQEKIHHAVSMDGATGWVTDSSEIFDKSQFLWADNQINGPAVLLDGSNLFLWFGGQGNINLFPNISMGIGLAICPL
jgi:hypothetical protein